MRHIDIKQNERSVIRQDASPLTVEIFVLERMNIGRLHGANFGVGHNAVESPAFGIGSAAPEAFVSVDGGAFGWLASRGEGGDGYFVFLEAEDGGRVVKGEVVCEGCGGWGFGFGGG